MPEKYYIKVNPAGTRREPVFKLSSIEKDLCLGCLDCARRDCIYDVYRHRRFLPGQLVYSTDSFCKLCMRCVQECKNQILIKALNPEYARLGNDYWKPEIITSLWSQAETGKIPVSGAGYGGPFSGPGFDSMWTDMSEIVRPTRDGIHGREYISTAIDIGRKPDRLVFGSRRRAAPLPPNLTIPLPIILDLPERARGWTPVREAVLRAAKRARIPVLVEGKKPSGGLAVGRYRLGEKVDPDPKAAMVELRLDAGGEDDRKRALRRIRKLQKEMPLTVICIGLPLGRGAAEAVLELVREGVGAVHLYAGNRGEAISGGFIKEMVREVHLKLVGEALRDRVTILAGGGIAMAEHVAKLIACGADGVVVDEALLVALECRMCFDCRTRPECTLHLEEIDAEWGSQRIVNLLGSWHSQLIEVLGAMGLREIRRLRGEVGRTMFFRDLEEECFAPLFGKRRRGAPEPAEEKDRPQEPVLPPRSNQPQTGVKKAKGAVKKTPMHFRNPIGKFIVFRSADCRHCGRCVEVCPYGVHLRSGDRMLRPRSHLCAGTRCAESERGCVKNCPAGALSVAVNPNFQALGDCRWTADLIVSTWYQAETGHLPYMEIESRRGDSGGGLDRMRINLSLSPAPVDPTGVDLSVNLNRRDDGRPDLVIDLPVYGGGMSFGSISENAMVARARNAAAWNTLTSTGEGGYPPSLYPYDAHVITQVATGLFGVREETIQRVRMVEFKYAQGAKPGLGGHLLGDKVTAAVARMRESVKGSALFSPFPFHSVYSIEDHKKHVDWIKQVNARAIVATKVSTPVDIGMVAVGSYYAGSHVIHLDGSYGGTGAAPEIAKKNIAMPIDYAINKTHRFLLQEGVRKSITLVASGGLRTAHDIFKAIALGADAVVLGTTEMVALGCLRCKNCESGRGCARGIATTDGELAELFSVEWAFQRLFNLYHAFDSQLRNLVAAAGLTSIKELVGRTDLLLHLDYENIE